MMRCFSISEWGKSFKHHWCIFLLTFLLVCIVGVVVMRVLSEPVYLVTGAIRVAPDLPNILRDESGRPGVSTYQSFLHTQAVMVTSNRVVQRVADDLADKGLAFFTDGRGGPADILKQAMSDRVITVASVPRTELLKVSMRSSEPEEAKQIVDAFIRSYMAVEVSSSTEGQAQKLSLLEDERKVLSRKVKNQREQIRQLSQEYGTSSLDKRQEMMLERVKMLLAELTALEARRINLEAKVKVLEESKDKFIAPEDLPRMRDEYVNSDPTVQALSQRIADFEINYVVAKLELSAEDPELKRKQEVIEALKIRLDSLKKQAGENFEGIISDQQTQAHERIILEAKAELKQAQLQEKRLRDVMAEEDTKAIQIGRRQIDIEELEIQSELDQKMYDAVRRRIQEVEMERKRPARVSVAYYSDVARIIGRRISNKYAAAIIACAIVFGMLLAFVREKASG
jgi:uncharacterized protein involved in exopolysaccharide biosynthesis